MARPDQLGFDPSVRRLELQKKTRGPSIRDCYEIDVHDSRKGTIRTFRTVDLDIIHASDERDILTRGTRVWKVRELVNGHLSSSFHVLKDVWLEHRASPWQLEGDVYRAIASFVAAHPEHEDVYRLNFLSVLTDGVVSGGDGSTITTRPSERYSAGAHSFVTSYYIRRLHYRIVFEEVAVPLKRLGSDNDTFEAISGAIKGTHFNHLINSIVR